MTVDDAKDDAAEELYQAKQSFLAAAQEGAILMAQLEKKLEDESGDTNEGETNGEDKKDDTDDNYADNDAFLAKARESFLAAAKEGEALIALMEDNNNNKGDAPTTQDDDDALHTSVHTSKSFMEAASLVDQIEKSSPLKEGGKFSSIVAVEGETEEEEVEEVVVEDDVEAAKKAFLQFAKEGASLVSKLESKFAAKVVAEDDDEEIIEEVIESDDEQDRTDFLQAAKADFLSFSKGLEKKLPNS